MADKFDFHRNNPDSLGRKFVAHTPVDADLPDGVKVVYFEGDGTCTVKNDDGTTLTGVVVKDTVPMNGVPARITAMAGSSRCILVI